MYLDDPADFGIWAKIMPGKNGEFRKWIAGDRGIREITAHQLFGEALIRGDIVQIYSGYGWYEIPDLIKNIPNFVSLESIAISVSDVSPTYAKNYCNEHLLFFRKGNCPVCSGNIIHRGKRVSPALFPPMLPRPHDDHTETDAE